MGKQISSDWRGLIAYTQGNMVERASKTSCSNTLNVWIISPEALGALSTASITKLKITSLGSIVWTKLGRSLSLMLLIPRIQSITVSEYPFVK